MSLLVLLSWFPFCVPGSPVGIDRCTKLRHGNKKSTKENTDVSMALWKSIPVAFMKLHQEKQILPDQFWIWNYHIFSLDSRLKITLWWGKPSGKPVETKSRRRGNRADGFLREMIKRLMAACFKIEGLRSWTQTSGQFTVDEKLFIF